MPAPIDLEIPFRIHETEKGLVFDLEVRGRSGGPTLAIMERSRWKLGSQRLSYAHNDATLEVLAEDGLPLVQFHFDEEERLILFGGRFFRDDGQVVLAFPAKLVAPSAVVEGGFAIGNSVSMASGITLGKVDVEKEARTLPLWFDYEGESPKLREDAFAIEKQCTMAMMVLQLCGKRPSEIPK